MPTDRPAAAPQARVGFLFNHDQTHQIAHSLPIALAMRAMGVPAEIVVITTNPRISAEVRRLGGPVVGDGIALVELGLSPRSRVLDALLGWVVPMRKLTIYGDNLDFFRRLDWLVVPEKTSLALKTRYGLTTPRIIHTKHGAGDRALGFEKASTLFDHTLCYGPKIRDRLAACGVDPAKMSITGYPKFDMVAPGRRLPPGFDPGKPTVIYNPHPSPHLSSWFTMGQTVLDLFLENPQWQLIFAPHIMLFQRPLVVTIDRLRIARPGRIAQKYRDAPNIHIDLGSSALTDMTYTAAADIYLGDVSSQHYEFLRWPRPCIFLNAHGVAWEDDINFLHWKTGEVIDRVADLPAALARAAERHAAIYRPVQERLFAEAIDLTDEPSSDRAARVIAHLIGGAA